MFMHASAWFSCVLSSARKAAFEAYVTLRDDAETAKLTTLAGCAAGRSRTTCRSRANLRNPKLGALARIRVVNVIFSGRRRQRGGADRRLQPAQRRARPQGERRQAGLLKNVQEAKFAKNWCPSEDGAGPRRLRAVAFDAFFSQIVVHEMMHGLGPHHVVNQLQNPRTGSEPPATTPRGQTRAGTPAMRSDGASPSSRDASPDGKATTTVRAALQDDYGALEEAKADISGLWALQCPRSTRGRCPRRWSATST